MNEEELFALLEEDMKDMPCEGRAHDSSPLHSGRGEWYISYVCPRCNQAEETYLCCDRYNSYLPVVMLLSGDTVVECGKCRSKFLFKETILTSEKRQI